MVDITDACPCAPKLDAFAKAFIRWLHERTPVAHREANAAWLRYDNTRRHIKGGRVH